MVQGGLAVAFGQDSPLFIVAYSDWSAGEIGTIYQACNWSYLGHRPTREWRGPDGRRYDINTPAVRAVSGFARRHNKELRATKEDIQRQKDAMVAEGYVLVDGPTRGRYATVAGKNGRKRRGMAALLAKHRRPYPKRAGDASRGDALASGQRGGFDSRRPLQLAMVQGEGDAGGEAS